MNATLFLFRTGGRFHPATQQQFNKYAEHLAWVIKCDFLDSREMLARMYHYQNAYELKQVLKMPGTPGPFYDAISLTMRGTKQLKAAIVDRNEYAMQVVISRINARRGDVQSKFTLQQLLALELFSSPLAHEAAFQTLAGPRSAPLLANSALAH